MYTATPQLSAHLEQVATEYLLTRYSGPGNPMGTEGYQVGSTVAFKVPLVADNELMNSVHGLQQASDLPGVLKFYQESNQNCWIHLTPYTDPLVTAVLVETGFRPSSYSAVLYNNMDTHQADGKSNPDIDIETVSAGSAKLESFLDTLNRGFAVPDSSLANLRENQSFWPQVSHWTLLLATIKGTPAGAAVISLLGDTAYLAAASTLPAYRGQGIHTALINSRLNLAKQQGCNLVTAQAEAGSTSQCNQQRAGLSIAYTKTIWTNAPWQDH